MVRRVIGKAGRGRVYINNVLATAAALGDVAGVLIELAGQHEHQTLGDPAQHLSILDAFGGHAESLTAMAAAHARIEAAARALGSATLDERTRAEREEFLKFQLKELVDAQLEPGEDERLKLERERLRAAEKLLVGGAARRGRDLLARGRHRRGAGRARPRARRSSGASIPSSAASASRSTRRASRSRRRRAICVATPSTSTPIRSGSPRSTSARICLAKLLRKHRGDCKDVAAI